MDTRASRTATRASMCVSLVLPPCFQGKRIGTAILQGAMERAAERTSRSDSASCENRALQLVPKARL